MPGEFSVNAEQGSVKDENAVGLKKAKRGKPKARGNGSGTVFKMPDGRFRWQYRNTTGKVLASGIAASKRDAEDKLAATRTEFLRGTLETTDRQTVSERAAQWLLEQRQVRPTTLRLYKYELDLALEFIGATQVRAVTHKDIKHLLSELAARTMTSGMGRGRGMSQRTLGMVLGRLRAVFADAVADRVIRDNPTTKVKVPKIAQNNPDEIDVHRGISLDFHEAARFQEIGTALHGFSMLRLWPALFTCISIGLRRGEVVALRWQDVDLERKLLMVRQNVTVEKGGLAVGLPKTVSGKRDIPITQSLHAALVAQRNVMIAEFAARAQPLRPNSPVFATESGTMPHPDNISRALDNLLVWSNSEPVKQRKVKKTEADKYVSLESRLLGVTQKEGVRAGLEGLIRSGASLPDISPHDLRHTAGTLMLRSGMNVAVVSKILGHAKVSITLDIYRHVLESEKRESMVDLFSAPIPVRPVAVIAALN